MYLNLVYADYFYCKQLNESTDMNQEYMDAAVALSRKYITEGEGGPFGSVIVRDNQIIGRGWNTVLHTADPTAHAEVNAIRDACARLGSYVLEGCTIYCSCEPCPMCLGAIYWARLSRVYFACGRADAAAAGFDDAFIYAELQRDIRQRSIPMTQLKSPEALQVLHSWKASGLQY